MADAFDLLRRVARNGEPALLLEGSRSVVAALPAASLCVANGEPWRRDGEAPWRRIDASPFDALRALAREAPRGSPGVAGFVSYDAGRLIERIEPRAEDDSTLPQLLFFRFDAAIVDGALVGDHAELERRASQPAPPLDAEGSIAPVRARSTPKEFEEMVVAAKRHVRIGDVFQVNLSHRLETDTTLAPLALYDRLRRANPAPHAGYFASGPLPDGAAPFEILSSSPERLFRLHGTTLEAKPIAGTRPRGATPADDARLRGELLADPKERAEHVMLVDLARNDLGRVARYGTVRVPRLLDVESYRTVHHLVSTVEAEIAPGRDAVDALVALFPGGTITGAPKVRAMEIIEALEPARRGAYTGSLGWIAPDGSCDFNILIRTILKQGASLRLQVGAGIVEDSDPHREYEETLAKAKGLLLALGRDAP